MVVKIPIILCILPLLLALGQSDDLGNTNWQSYAETSDQHLSPFNKWYDSFLKQTKGRQFNQIDDDDDDEDADDDREEFHSVDMCSRLLLRYAGEEPMGAARYFLRSMALVNCIIVSDAVFLPRTIAHDYRRSYKSMKEKSSYRYLAHMSVLPFTFVKSIAYQPLRTWSQVIPVAVGSVAYYPAISENGSEEEE